MEYAITQPAETMQVHRRKGRPQIRWLDHLTKHASPTWMTLAQNRVDWKVQRQA